METLVEKGNGVAARSLRELLREYYGSNGHNGRMAQLVKDGNLSEALRAKVAICKAAFTENHGQHSMAAADVDRAMEMMFKRGTYASSASCPNCCKQNVIRLGNHVDNLARELEILEGKPAEKPVRPTEKPKAPDAVHPQARVGTFVYVLLMDGDQPQVHAAVADAVTSGETQMVELLTTGKPMEVKSCDMHGTINAAYSRYRELSNARKMPMPLDEPKELPKVKAPVKAGQTIDNGEIQCKVTTVDATLHIITADHDGGTVEIPFAEFGGNWSIVPK